MTRREPFAFGLLACLVLFMAGCESSAKVNEGVPPSAKLVGKGKGFTYIVPADGMMYRMRGTKREGVRTMKKGETYQALGPVEGDNPTKNFDDYEYYFDPLPVKDVEQPKYGR